MSRETQTGSSHRRLLPAFLLAIPASLLVGFLLGGGDARHARAARPAETAPPQVASPEPEPGPLPPAPGPPAAPAAPAASAEGEPPLDLLLRDRLVRLEEHPGPGAAEELLRIRAEIPDALAEDYARAAAAQAVFLAGAGAAEASARLARSALEALADRLAAVPAPRGETWRAARVVLERLEWVGPGGPADPGGPLGAIRAALERAIAREAGRTPTEAAAEAMALAEVVGGDGVARASLDLLRAGEANRPPTTREAHLVLAHAARAAVRHGDPAQKAEARAWVERRLARARTRAEERRMLDLLDSLR